jgi:NitT/TauT family transport system substrate-binding protein
MGDSPFVLAFERGYFAAEGLDVEFVPFGSSTDALAAVATGELDAMPSGINPALFNMFARGVPVQIVASGSRVGQGYDWYGLLVRNDHLDSGEYKGPRDLRGMKVGIPAPYVSSHYMLKVLLEKNGLSLADVESVPVGLADGVPAIANGAIDALASIEPFLATSERQGYGKRVIGAVDIVPDFPGGLVLLSPGLPERNRLAADGLILAWLRGVRDYLDAFTRDRDREAAITALRKHGIDYSTLVQNPTFDPNGRFQIEGLRSPLDWYLRDGVLREQIDLSQVVNFDYVDRAAQRLGPYQ